MEEGLLCAKRRPIVFNVSWIMLWVQESPEAVLCSSGSSVITHHLQSLQYFTNVLDLIGNYSLAILFETIQYPGHQDNW